MERRIYFIVGDLLACVLSGAAAGWLADLAVPANWPTAIGMVAGIGLGTLAGAVGGIVFSPFFGAMEVTLAAMLAGMVGGMAGVLSPIGSWDATWNGAAAGLLGLVFTYAVQAKLHGEVR